MNLEAWCRLRLPVRARAHNGQCNHYRATLSQNLLTRRGVGPSTSRKGNCYVSAPVEGFFSSLKSELAVQYRQFQK